MITKDDYNKVLRAYKIAKEKFRKLEERYYNHMIECSKREAHIKYLEWKVKDLEEKLNYDDRKRL